MNIFLRTLGILTILFIAISYISKPTLDNPYNLDSITIETSKGSITALVANTEQSRQQGLSDRDNIAMNNGMLFEFPNDGKYSFWMKDMHFPLDIIWIDSQKKIVDISSSVSPETYPKTFIPRSPVRYVLEINAGAAEKFDLKEGNQLEF